jgi:Ubiquinol-cytochrome-c reductase complex subunit (QCR10)
MAAGMGATALIALLFFAEEIPTVKKDIFQNLPIIGGYWVKTVAPEDNPF